MYIAESMIRYEVHSTFFFQIGRIHCPLPDKICNSQQKNDEQLSLV